MSRDFDTHFFRGFLQSDDGQITKVIESDVNRIVFETAFGLSPHLADRLKHQSRHIIFSERSRIARLGVQITCEPPTSDAIQGKAAVLRLTASSVIPGYPVLKTFEDFFVPGFPVGRLVFCDPDALLTSDAVIAAIEKSQLKLPASTTITSDGSILISPHRVVCDLKGPLDRKTLSRILFKEEGREILNRYQLRRRVSALTIPAGQGAITTCSMYLNEHYVVLQSRSNATLALGSHLPATLLDPIKTRGIRIYLEIVNNSRHPLVNPLILAKIYRAPKSRPLSPSPFINGKIRYSYSQMKRLQSRFPEKGQATCHYLDKSAALLPAEDTDAEDANIKEALILKNGPIQPCPVSRASCAIARQDFSLKSACTHLYATAKIRAEIKSEIKERPGAIALQYFPNILEHIDIVNLAKEGLLEAIYFFHPSCEHGPFLSQLDHHRLQEYHAFGVDVFWVSDLTKNLMVHTMRDGKGYFVTTERLADFHKSMLFAFYGSTKPLSGAGVKRLGKLMDALIRFWGKNIGIVTGGGSGVMEHANTFARKRGILSGANYLDITDQAMTTDVDFCQVFQAACRHSRQKWFEIASFPIFNVGGLGSLEELGITLCNMKLSIMEPVPVVLFDSDGDGSFWGGISHQIKEMIAQARAPEWIGENLIITGDPEKVIAAYRERLQLF